eukprot:g43936.t1
MDRICRDSMYKTLDKRRKNVPNAILILMASFVCGCIELCVDPKYANIKCHYLLRFYLSLGLRRMGLALLRGTLPMGLCYHTLLLKQLHGCRDCHTPAGMCLCKGSLEKDEMVFVEVRPEQFRDTDHYAVLSVPQTHIK